jgi:hypothetical protein
MTINYTTLLGLAKPVTGTETGDWGNVVNNEITSLLEDSVANASTISVTAANVTLSTTSGSSNEARMSTLIITGTPGTTRNVVAPSQAKIYQVINQSNSSVVIKGAATTGVTIVSGATACVVWNGSDFVIASVAAIGMLQGLGTGVATAAAAASNTTGGLVTQPGTLAANALLLGGGSGTGVSSTTTGTGVVTALGNNANATGGFATINGTATLTNKRIDPRTSTSAATATLTPDISAFDQYNLTAQDQALTVAAPTGTPVDGNKLILRILDNGTARAITWNATYTAIGTILPTTTVINKMLYVGCIYNSTNTRWDVVAVTTQA